MDQKLTEHLEAIRHWLDKVEATPLPESRATGLTILEKQELRRVEGLIEQLKNHGVTAIPPELIEKKNVLATRDAPDSPPSEAAMFLPALEELREELGELSKKARILRDQVRSRTANNGPRAHYDVEPLDLLKAGFLSTDDRLELQWANTSGAYEGRLESDGRIRANVPHYRSACLKQ